MLTDIDCYTNGDVAYKEFPLMYCVSFNTHMWVSVKLFTLQNFQTAEIFPIVTVTDSVSL